MYSDIKSVQLLVALLKEHGIRRVVCSPGNRNVPIVHSLEEDSFFETYSIVDERSAGFFGIGLIQRYREPVAICCTSGTAVCNYYSAVVEAYYQKLPLLIISADRNPYYLNQDEEQMLPQTEGFEKVTKKIVQLPMVKDEADEYICARKINEAILELNHHGMGPVQINIPLEAKLAQFHTETLPAVRKIQRHEKDESWKELAELLYTKKILVLYGQASPLQDEDIHIIEKFSKRFDAVIATDPLANLCCAGTISTFLLSRVLNAEEFEEMLCPDIVITLHSGYMSYVRSHLKSCKNRIVHWAVNESGTIIDPFMSIERVFEIESIQFMSKMLSYELESNSDNTSYIQEWQTKKELCDSNNVDIPWSDLYLAKELISGIPCNSKLHLANSSSVRLAAHFDIDKSIEVYCNRGANGIDGSASAYMGMAHAADELCYLLIGDLSFFYDMNSLWNNYISSNMRIVLSNNEGATLFHYTVGIDNVPCLDKNIAAEHNATAKGWVESRGFKYIKVTNEDELEEAIQVMADRTLTSPVFVEVFTDKEEDAKILRQFYASIRKANGLSNRGNILKKILKTVK
ncbi:MAG: 2-succinyl-5-enolpyruvyl-6-hydroxy-3-cyclohexene-1-carboxylic-acid synthase [Tyzzerella sp.]|nr:2-succinyl-5-enolpyruvyl-6-hydroxy-3-cyclohexene-1-carboxylic-acid synthase [Tyzzerella sp.]